MREELDRLLHDLTLVTLALAIALGWSLFQFAQGAADLITTLFIDYSDTPGVGDPPLTWEIGDRLLTLYQLVRGAVEVAVVLGVAIITRRFFAKPS